MNKMISSALVLAFFLVACSEQNSTSRADEDHQLGPALERLAEADAKIKSEQVERIKEIPTAAKAMQKIVLSKFKDPSSVKFYNLRMIHTLGVMCGDVQSDVAANGIPKLSGFITFGESMTILESWGQPEFSEQESKFCAGALPVG